MRFDRRDVIVIMALTGLRQSTVQVIMVRLRKKGYQFKNRYQVQRVLERLCKQGLVHHDKSLQLYEINMPRAKAYLAELDEEIKLLKKLKEQSEMHVQYGSAGVTWI